jgi:exo-beta-1,3-glucanase (GH17 family)
MAAHDFAQFSWDEQEDVKAVLASCGRDLSEFSITDTGSAPAGGQQAGEKAATRRVCVTRLANGKTATYETDHFAPWITDFDQALQAGEFDD